MLRPSPLASETIERIWISAAAQLGFSVVRSDAAYASNDGRGTLIIGERASLDDDDAVAQLVFHELCHGLIQGPHNRAKPDWGLSNDDGRDVWREHACLRLHVFLAAPYGLRGAMAPTTEYRAYHDALSDDPFAPPEDAAARLARAAVERPDAEPWLVVMRDALERTRRELRCADDGARADSPPTSSPPASSPPIGAGRHASGFAIDASSPETCADCAWFYVGGRGRAVARCRAAAGGDGVGVRIEADSQACERWEPKLDCQTCGACCREAYHSVTVAVRDPVVWKHPDLIVRHGHRFEIRREDDRCAALLDRRGEATTATPLFSCSIYEDRPSPCRQFENGGPNCLIARRRVGLTR